MSGQIEFKDLAFEVKSTPEEVTQGIIKGYAAVYGNVDSVNDRILPGAAKKSITERGVGMPVGWQHDINDPLGTTVSAEEHTREQMPANLVGKDSSIKGGVYVVGQAVMTRNNKDRMKQVKEGPVRGLSIGYIPIRYKYVSEGGKTVRELGEIKMVEWSPVTIGANELAGVLEAKSADLAKAITDVKAVAGSFERMRDMVCNALQESGLLGNVSCYPKATFADRVVVRTYPKDPESREPSKLIEVPYEQTDNGFKWGTPREVETVETITAKSGPIMLAQALAEVVYESKAGMPLDMVQRKLGAAMHAADVSVAEMQEILAATVPAQSVPARTRKSHPVLTKAALRLRESRFRALDERYRAIGG